MKSTLRARLGRFLGRSLVPTSAPARRLALALLAASLAGAATPAFAFDVNALTPSSVSLQGVNYYSAPVFADAVKMTRSWNRSTSYSDIVPLSELNAVGLPKSSSSTAVFQSWFEGGDDKSWVPGRYVVTWTGTGDVRLTGSNVTFVSGTAAGAANGGRRVYTMTAGSRVSIELRGLTADGLSSLNVWMPHPDDPANTSLEPAERSAYNTAKGITEHAEAIHFNPVLVRLLKERGWNSIRFMDWMQTNNNPSRNWSERRLPSRALQSGGLVSRNPATGASPEYKVVDGVTTTELVYRDPGISWEYAIALCNATGRNLWINVPHLSVLSLNGSDDYISNLARIIAYGSDENGQPYASTYTGAKVWKPLASNLEVFVEYSNEVWNGMFAQQKWNDAFTGTNVPQQMAIHSNQVWQAMETVSALKSGSTDRVVRLLGCQQVTGSNLTSSLNKLYGATSGGGLGSYADAVTTATYFGNSIENYVRDAILEGQRHPRANEKDSTQPGGQYPAYTYTDEAWARIDNDAYFNKAFDEWTRRVLFGDSDAGNAFDTTGKLGGIGQDVFDAAAARGLRIVATEGGASIYTDKFDNGSPYDDLLTNFVADFPLKQRMADLMKIHLELTRSRGLRSYNIFTLTGDAGKSGQWGVVDLDGKQDTSAKAIRYRAIREWFDEFATIRPVGSPVGTAPSFTTAEDLGDVRIGSALTKSIATSNATSLIVVGKILVPGLSVSVSGTSATISGTPSKNGLNYVLLRAMDGDKDPAWRIFRFTVKDWAKHIYFNNLAAGAYSAIEDQGFLVSSGDAAASLQIAPIGGTATSAHGVRVTTASPAYVDRKTASADPLNNIPFNLDSIRLGRGNTTVTGVLLEALSEAGAVIKQDPIALTGAVDTLAAFDRDANWDNVYSVRITFYSAVSYNSTTKRYEATPAPGGIIDDIKVNL